MTAVTVCSDFGGQENKDCHCFHCFPIYLTGSDGTGCCDLKFFFFFNLFVFYWRIIALQNFAVFHQTSTWISHRYAYIPSLLKLLPISFPSHPSRLIKSPCLSFLSHTANSHWLSVLHISFHVTLSIHLTLSSPLPKSISLFSMSASPLLEVLKFFECWVLSQVFHSPLSLSSRGSLVPLSFLP